MRNRMSVSRCCCGGEPADCTTCTSELPAELVVDLGVGGWTDNTCEVCDQAVGEIVVTNTTNCNWEFEGNSCDSPCAESTGCADTLTLRVRATMTDLFFTVLWQVRVTLSNANDPECACEAGATAIYESAEIDKADCGDLPITLNKISETVHANTCLGTLPASITLEA